MFCAKINRTCLKLTVYWVAYEPSLQITHLLWDDFGICNAWRVWHFTWIHGWKYYDAPNMMTWFQRCLVNEDASRKWVVEDVCFLKKGRFLVEGTNSHKSRTLFFWKLVSIFGCARSSSLLYVFLKWWTMRPSGTSDPLGAGRGVRVVEDVGIKFLGLLYTSTS